MNIIVLGATGKTGRLVISQLLDYGHRVTAYVRTPKKINQNHPNLIIVEGALDDRECLSSATVNQDMLISCLGLATPFSKSLLHPYAPVIRDAMIVNGCRRILYLAAAGVHYEISGLMGLLIEKIMGNVLGDHRASIACYQDESFDITIFRPVLLTNGRFRPDYKVALVGIPGIKPISRRTLSHCIATCVQESLWVNESVGLSGE